MESMDSLEEWMIAGVSDFFDRLPDEVLLLIFKKVGDVKSLCVSMSVCRRFRMVAAQVDEVSLPVPVFRRKPPQEREGELPWGLFIKDLVIKALMKPFYFISQMIKFKSQNHDNCLDEWPYRIPTEALNPFEEIKGLHLRLPSAETTAPRAGKTPATFLKWTAEFGRELRSCVVLGAKSWRRSEEKPVEFDRETRGMSEEEMKLRIVWTISCLMAASGRHLLVEETTRNHKTIEKLVVSDDGDQGRLLLNKEMLEELRLNRKLDETQNSRAKIPALRLKMWYLEKLELSHSGGVMEGPTLVVVWPTGDGAAEELQKRAEDTAAAAFFENGDNGKLLTEAVKKLMLTKKCYTLEMNLF